MPEGDTVRRTCARLHQALAGRELLAAELRWPGLSTAALTASTVLEVVAYGKHILMRLDSGWTLRSHLRMEGAWVIEAALGSADDPARIRSSSAAPRRRPRMSPRSLTRFEGTRAVLVNAEWTALGIHLGMLDLVRTNEESSLIGHLGPDILSDDFTVECARENLADSATSIGAALLDQTNLAGIGTFWACEALFVGRIFPWRAAAQLSRAETSALLSWARTAMTASLAHAVPSSTGSRRPGEISYVHARNGHPCRRCGATVAVAPIGPPTRERPLFYCPACQPGPDPSQSPQRNLTYRT